MVLQSFACFFKSKPLLGKIMFQMTEHILERPRKPSTSYVSYVFFHRNLWFRRPSVGVFLKQVDC